MADPLTLSPEDLDALKKELSKPAYAGLTDTQRFAALSAPTAVPNPAKQGSVLKPFGFADVMGPLSDVSVAAIRDTPNTTDLIDKINAGDRVGVAHWGVALLKAPAKISQDEFNTIFAVIQATMPDPAWPATVPGPSPKDTLFPGKTWVRPDGSTVDYIPLDDVGAAR